MKTPEDEGVIGRLSWEACESCEHWDIEEGGCELDEEIQIEPFAGDWVICTDWKKQKKG